MRRMVMHACDERDEVDQGDRAKNGNAQFCDEHVHGEETSKCCVRMTELKVCYFYKFEVWDVIQVNITILNAMHVKIP